MALEPLGVKIREIFDDALTDYRERTGEALSEGETRIVEGEIGRAEDSTDVGEKNEAVFVVLYMSAYIRHGFSVLEHIHSCTRTYLRQLQRIGVNLEEKIESPVDAGRLRGLMDTWALEIGRLDELNSGIASDHETSFWQGLLFSGLPDQDEEDREYVLALFAHALSKPLPRKMECLAMQEKGWGHASLGQWEDALDAYYQLIGWARLPETVVLIDECIGYIRALEDYDVRVKNPYMFVPPADEFKEDGAESDDMIMGQFEAIAAAQDACYASEPEQVADTIVSCVKDLKEHMSKLLEFKDGVGELMRRMEEKSARKPPTYLEVEEEVRRQHKWVDSLANGGALVNAEFLRGALSRMSWGEVITGYSNAVEGELKSKLIRPLSTFLLQRYRGTKLRLGTRGNKVWDVDVQPSRTDLGSIELLLEKSSTNQRLRAFFTSYRAEDQTFLTKQLPERLSELRHLRNPPSHGEKIRESDRAEQARSIALEILPRIATIRRGNAGDHR